MSISTSPPGLGSTCAPLVHEQLGLVGIHGGVRFSIGAFNTEKHIDATIEAMADITERAKVIGKKVTT